MFVALLLQAAQFLPAPTPVTGLPDTNYARQLLEHSQEFSVSQKQLESLHPATPAQFAEATIFAMGSEAQARLASMVLAGTENDAAARALYRAGCEATTSNTAVVCLLAPASLPPGVAPALAYLAQDPSKALAVRAAALARLIEHGRFGAWPLARALFQGGTRAALVPPAYANWPQGSRWELAKRTVLLSLNLWLDSQGYPHSNFEPNASWKEQLEQLADTDALVAAAATESLQPDPRYGARRLQRAQTLALLDAAVAGDAIAKQALPWLMPHAGPTLQEAAQQDASERATLAALILAEPPR